MSVNPRSSGLVEPPLQCELRLIAAGIAARPGVEFAHPDSIYWARRHGGGYIPNDPQFSSQWGLDQANDQDMNAPEAWMMTTGDPAIEVVADDAHTPSGSAGDPAPVMTQSMTESERQLVHWLWDQMKHVTGCLAAASNRATGRSDFPATA